MNIFTEAIISLKTTLSLISRDIGDEPVSKVAMSAFIPMELENYVFIAEIKGTTLWTGRDKRTNDSVVVRMIEGKNLFDRELSKFTAEVAFLNKINHPKVAKLREIVDSYGWYFMVYEPMQGMSVDKFIATKGPIDEARAQTFIGVYAEIAEDVRQQTGQTVILSSDKVMVNEQCEIVQVYARSSESLFLSEMSVQFRSPESITQGKETPQAVVWCAGVMLFYIVTGKMPFEGADPQETERNVTSRPPAFQDGLTPALHGLLIKMLTKNPVTRIGMTQISNHEWMESAPPSVRSSFTKMPTQKLRPGGGNSLFGGTNPFKSDPNLSMNLTGTAAPGMMSIQEEDEGAHAEAAKPDDRPALKARGTGVRLTPRKGFMGLVAKKKP